jgi:Glycosyl hydrolase catalytic core
VPVNQGPAQKVRYPNVAFSTMKQFEKDLDKWFGRKNIPVWVTEYGNETKPGEPKGVTEAQQAAYVPQAISFAKKDPRIPMFIWFVFRDSAGSPWQSGVYRTSGAAKPAASKWSAAARPVDKLNGKVSVKGGTANPLVNVNFRDMCTNNVPGAQVGVTWRAFSGTQSVALGQTSTLLAFDCTITVRLTGLVVAKGKTYRVEIDANTATTPAKRRVLTIVGT